MPIRPIRSFASDRQLAQEVNFRDARRSNFSYSLTPDIAQRVGELGDSYPGMEPGVLMAGGLAGLSPNSPEMMSLAQRVYDLQYQETGGFQIGEMVDPKTIQRAEQEADPFQGIRKAGKSPSEFERPEDVERFLGEYDPENQPEHTPGRMDPITRPLRGFSRGLFTGLHGLRQTVSGALMGGNLIGGDRRKTVLDTVTEQWRKGNGIDLGSGWFPGGTAMQESRISALDTQTTESDLRHVSGLPGGKAERLTPGRVWGPRITGLFHPWSPVEPGSREYRIASATVDLGNAIFLDPIIAPLKAVQRGRQATKTFQALGPMDMLKESLVVSSQGRKSTVAENVAQWGDSRAARGVFQRLAKTDSVTDLMERLKGIDKGTALKIADETDPTAIKELLMPKMGTHLRLKPTARGLATKEYISQIGRVLPESTTRLFSDMPNGMVGLDDPQASWNNLQNVLKTAGMGKDRIESVNRAFAGVESYDQLFAWSRNSLSKSIADQIQDTLWKGENVKPKVKQRIGHLTNLLNPDDADRAYWVKAASGETADSVLSLYNPITKKPLPSTHVVAETLHRGIPLPDARELRALTRKGLPARMLRTVLDSPVYEAPKDLVELLGLKAFKTNALLRGAYTVRVMSEEVLRIGATSMNRFVNNPAAMITWFLSRYANDETGVGKLMARVSRGGNTALGEAFEDMAEFQGAMARETDWRYPGLVSLNEWGDLRKGTNAYLPGITDEYAKMASDEIASLIPDAAVYQHGGQIGVDAIKQSFWDGPLSTQRKILGDTEHRKFILSDRPRSDKHIDEVVDRIQELTGGDPELLKWINSGSIDGVRIRNRPFNARKVQQSLERKMESLPDFVGGQRRGTPNAAQKMGGQLQRGVDWMFKWLATNPSNVNRSTVMRQDYWKRMTEQAAFVDADGAKRLIANAKKARLPNEMMSRLLGQAKGKGTHNLEGLELIARYHAAQTVKDLFYDLSRRNNFFDMFRLIIPFGDAWKEVVTTWSKIGTQNPMVAQRAHTAITGARDTDHNEGRGFFYRDDFGQEIFAYPMIGALASRMLGTGPDQQLAFTGGVQGLNMIGGSVLPGFGPILQVPLKPFMRDLQSDDFLRQIVFPYGEPGSDEGFDPLGDVWESIIPPWMRKINEAFSKNSDRHIATTAEMLQLEATSGRWDLSNEEDILSMQREASKKAKTLLLIRGISQSILPTGPQPEFKTKTEVGDWIHFRAIGDQKREWTEEYGELEAVAMIEHVFGFDNLQGTYFNKTRSNREMPVTIEGNRFLKANPDLYEKYPDVIGFFSTDPEPGTFDYLSFVDQIVRGDRVRLSPDQIAHSSNNALGYLAYQKQQQQALMMFGSLNSEDAREYLRMVRMDLEEKFPGFGRDNYQPQRPRPEQLISDMEKAIQDPRLRDSEVGPAITEYLAARNEAVAYAQSIGLQSFNRSKDTAVVRDFLRDLGEDLVERNPSFRVVWERLFLREFLDESLEQDQGTAFMDPGIMGMGSPTGIPQTPPGPPGSVTTGSSGIMGGYGG